MRKAFVETLVELAHSDERIVLLTADLGFMVLEPFRDQFPKRFFNVGVMEQNMIGLATGLAMQGFIPYVYSIATFASMRGYEFIRNGPMVHQQKIRIVGVGTGFDYSFDGLSHYALEDVGLMRTLPSVSIIAPADSNQTRKALKDTYDLPGPIYYRLSKYDALHVPALRGAFTYKEIELIRPGKDCLLVTCGSVTADVMLAAERLSQLGIECAVAVIATIQPIDIKQIRLLLAGYTHVFSYEANYHVGGVGSLLAETIARYNLGCTLISQGLTYTPGDLLGSQAYLHQKNKVDMESIVLTVKDNIWQNQM